jgi:D-beta-D-heptose 7-phosphate kinase/D-beta-D-heptose 1-phosphate adenosyltransferase
VILFDEDTPLNLINELQPDVLIKGGDYTLETIVGAKEVLSYGGKVEIIPFLEGYSTTNVIEKING